MQTLKRFWVNFFVNFVDILERKQGVKREKTSFFLLSNFCGSNTTSLLLLFKLESEVLIEDDIWKRLSRSWIHTENEPHLGTIEVYL